MQPPTLTFNAMNILITEAHTDANIGSGALVENALTLLRERYPEASFKVIAIHPLAFEELCGVESLPDRFGYPYRKPLAEKLLWAAKTLFWMGCVWFQRSLPGARQRGGSRWFADKLAPYDWADLVVSVHAERIKESFHVDPLYTLFSWHMTHLLGKPLVIFPCTLGPYGRGTRFLVDRWLRDVDLLFARDDLSFRLALEARGMTPTKVVRCPDVAVIQTAIPPAEARALIGVQPDEPLAGISVMRWRYILGDVGPYGNYEAYVAEMAKTVDALVERYGTTVVLYPTNYAERGCTTEDREAGRDVLARVRNKTSVRLVTQRLTPAQLKGALACSEVNITTRMHACIFSTGAGVPTLSINYLPKLREYMSHLGLDDYSIDIEAFNADWMLAAFQRAWEHRTALRAQIEEHMAGQRKQLRQAMTRLEDIVPVPENHSC